LFYDKIICVSEYDRQTAIENKIAPINKLMTIHNGINLKTTSFLPRQEAQKKLLNGKTSSLVIGAIAEWTKNKGLIYLLEALPKINSSIKQFDVVLIGSGENPDKEKLQNFIKKHNLKNIHLIEYIDNAASYLKAFDIFILPSIKEGLPYTILEAMAAEVPIVATKVGGIPEMLSPSLRVVLSGQPLLHKGCPSMATLKPSLVPSKNSHQLAEKILYLINNPAIGQKLAEKARQKVEQEFNLTKMIQETKDVY
jgi:glycosyltransferase involved in cell wall biosynthesis